MKLFQRLKDLVGLLEPYSGTWMVCGGVAACIYRDVPRYTGDIDIALADSEKGIAAQIATDVMNKLGYKETAGYITDQTGKLLPGQALVIGREEQASSFLGVDFLLPTIPWVTRAVVRAQENKLDFGFAVVPTITVEDLFIAKIFALLGTPSRINDRDDLLSILGTSPPFDREYFRRTALELKLDIPDEFSNLVTSE